MGTLDESGQTCGKTKEGWSRPEVTSAWKLHRLVLLLVIEEISRKIFQILGWLSPAHCWPVTSRQFLYSPTPGEFRLKCTGVLPLTSVEPLALLASMISLGRFLYSLLAATGVKLG